MAAVYQTPEDRDTPQSSGYGWFYAGAGAIATAATALALAKNPAMLAKVAGAREAAGRLMDRMGLFSSQRLREAAGKALGTREGSLLNAGMYPSATHALRPQLFSEMRGLLGAWSAGAEKDILRQTLAEKYSIPSRGKGYNLLTAGQIYERFKDLPAGTPYSWGRYNLDPNDVEALKISVEQGLVSKDWVADKGIFTSGEDILNAHGLHPEKWAESLISGIKKLPLGPFLTDTVLPFSHFTKSVPEIARVSTKGMEGFGIDPNKIENAFKVGPKVFGIGEGKMFEIEGAKVGPIGNAISRAQLGRQGHLLSKTVDQMKEEGVEFAPGEEKLERAREWIANYTGIGIGERFTGDASLPIQTWRWAKRHFEEAVSTIPGKTVEEVYEQLNWADKANFLLRRKVKGLEWLASDAATQESLGAAKSMEEAQALAKKLKWRSGAPYGNYKVSPEEMKIAAKLGEELHQTALHEYYAYSSQDMLKNLLYATVETPYRVAETMFGFGLVQDSLWKTALRATVGVPALGVAAWQAAKYADYLTENVTGLSPIKGVVGAYATAQVGRQGLLNLMGISAVSRIAEQVTGIDPNSPLSILTRTTMLPLVGAAIGRRLGPGMARKGFWIGAGLAALTLNDDLAMDAGELSDIYAGKQEVEIKKSRWWSLGVDPFMGGETAYYRKHAVASIMSDAAYTESQYGSKSEYWSHGTIFPTPSNLFGMGIVADPYYYERKHYYDRPYPVTGGMFKEVPIWGNILDTTLGSVIKPKKIMHPDELNQYMVETPEWSGEKGLEGAAARLSMEQIRPMKVVPRIEGTQDDIGHAIYDWTEYAGLKGFLMSTMKEKVTGSPDFSDTGARWAMADQIYSNSREYYDMQLGGMAGFSEFFRRFLPHRQKQIDYVNPLANTMPSWLPGKASAFDDADFIDFHHGDPYTKLPEGEKRLPGAAYEALHDLHSGKPGYYDAFDRMRVLADIAPYSNAFKYYKNVVDQMADQGQLDGEWLNQYKTIDARIMGRNGPQAEDVLSQGSNTFPVTDQPRHALGDFMGLRIPWVGDKLMSRPVDPLRDYQERVVLGNDFNDWRHPIDTMLMPFMRVQANTGPISGALGGASLGIMGAWAGSPVAGTVGAVGAVAGGIWGAWGVGVPEEEERRRTTEEYFDSLRYLKLRKVQKEALKRGDTSLANQAGRMTKSTMVGLDYDMEPTQFYKAAYSALPKRDREYFQAFLESNPQDRPEVLKSVPEYMQPMLMKIWGTGYDKNAQKRSGLTQGMADEEAIQLVQSHGGVPDEDWIGWNPDVDLRDVKIKTVAATGQDIHNFSFWGNDERDVARAKPYIRPAPFTFNTSRSSQTELNFKKSMLQYGFTGGYINVVQNPSLNARDYHSIQLVRDRRGDIASIQSREGGRY